MRSTYHGGVAVWSNTLSLSYKTHVTERNDRQDKNSSLDDPIITEEMKFAISLLKNNKARGPDGIIDNFFKYLIYIKIYF